MEGQCYSTGMCGVQCVKHGTPAIIFVNNHIKGLIMNNLKRFASECVDHYATYNKFDEFYSLDVSDLPDFVKHEFASLIMSNDESYAHEATGPDNNHWDDKMLPALTKYLANSTDRDNAVEFTNVWRDCVADYMTQNMQKLIDDALCEFNNDRSYIRSVNYHYGIPTYGFI